MNEKEVIEELQREGFKNISVHSFGSNMEFPKHPHAEHTAHVILDGILTTWDGEGERTFKKGDRFEISAGTEHSAKCGPKGCSFVVGIKN